MKKYCVVLVLVLVTNLSLGQSQEVQQLLLNWEKLMQFKKNLQNMYDGWKIIEKGYTTIKDISSGSFNLHQNFLDALMKVSPAIKKYKRITDIINYQVLIVKQYKKAFNQFRTEGSFTPRELDYIGKVYSNLFSEGIKSLDELYMVITDGQLRMTDDERMQAIDQIYLKIEDQFLFLQDFNASTSYLSLQRKSEQAEIDLSKKISGF